MLESDRGRRFLSEFLKRNKTPETREILTAIQRLEKSMTRKGKIPDLDQIRLDIGEMHDAIERTKAEIANIKVEGEESNRFVNASYELDAIVSQTEGATQTILEAAEQIQEQAWILREAGADDAVCDEIDAKSTEIFMACSFQDLTGQRTNKVVQVLRYLESRINMMINIWGLSSEEVAVEVPVDTRPDAHLLNGPQTDGSGVSQANVDDMFGSDGGAGDQVAADFDFDAIDVGDDTAADDTAADEAASVEMDAADIDSMFDKPAATAEPEAAAAVADEMDFDAIDVSDEVAEEPAQEEAEVEAMEGGDVEMGEDDIDNLFGSEMAAAEETEEADQVEAAADEDWEKTEASADDEEDPLTQLSEAERQALFN